MPEACVAIVKGKEPVDMTLEALELVNAKTETPPYERFLVKPNFVVAKHPSTGTTTDARVVEGVVKFLRNQGVKTVVVGEGSGFAETHEAFRLAGVDGVAERYGVSLVDLNRDKLVEVEIPRALALKRVRVAQTALNSSIVSVPKLKLHSLTGVTLSLKNMIGAVSPKGSMHTNLDEKIVDLNSVIKPRLAVVDGIVGGAGGELGSTPVKMSLVIAGVDPVAVDAVGAAVMGINPNRVRHIGLAEARGLGVGSLSKIRVLGQPVDEVMKRYEDM